MEDFKIDLMQQNQTSPQTIFVTCLDLLEDNPGNVSWVMRHSDTSWVV